MTKQADKVSWFEMPADDVGRVSAFYNKVFGWATPPMGDDATFALTVKADENGNPTEVGEYGLSMALFSDTEGNIMGIYNYGAAK